METSRNVDEEEEMKEWASIAEGSYEEMKEWASIAEGSYDDEDIQMLLDRESGRGEIMHPDWVIRARLDGVQYILKARERLRFRAQTAYASVTYLDRFLSRRTFDEEKCWVVRLLSMACLSLAAKMEEITVPALPDFCSEDYSFESSVIQRMELLVLNTLEWKMGLISPFGFLHFFANKFCGDSPRNGVFKTAEVVLGSVIDTKIMCYRPSVVAAAATLVVLDRSLTSDALKIKISPLTSSFPFRIEEILACYDRLQEMDNERLRLSKDIKSPDLSPVQLHTQGSSSVTSSSRKRKRLVFSENDENENENDKRKT